VAIKSEQRNSSERAATVGFMAAGVAHEINNPLSIISGYAELILRQLVRSDHDPASLAEAAQGLRIIRDEAFRCKEITQKLLSLATAAARRHEPVSLGRVAQDVAEMVRGLKRFSDRRVVLAIDEPPGRLSVLGNRNEIKQVLLNLTVNALEATQPHRGEVRVQVRRPGEAWVELIVSDNGRGMTHRVLERVFEPFFSAKRSPRGGEHGTGLGLSITRTIVDSHGGEIHAESEGPGRGSRFIVRLPATPEVPLAV